MHCQVTEVIGQYADSANFEVVFTFALHADVKEQIRGICTESLEACSLMNGDKIQNVFFYSL